MKVRCTALSSDEGVHFPMLAEAGFEPLACDRSRNLWDADQLIHELKDCVAVVAGSEPYTASILDALPELRVISRTGVGFDAIDIPACDQRGIVVATTPGVNHEPVAEHAIAMLVAVARRFPERDQLVRRGTWIRKNTNRIAGSTLGLVGFGRIGQAVATRAIGLGMKVIAYDPFPNQEFATRHGIKLVSLEELWPESDYVSLHLPGTTETQHLINRDTLAQMKKGAILINTARGSLVDEAALGTALRTDHLGGAGLDVFEVEPLPKNSPLLEMENVLLSGHVAGLDVEALEAMLKMAAETIIALESGQWPAERIQNLELNADSFSWNRSMNSSTDVS